ncbi:MAG: hypothetical protein JST86_01700 [Bacteroidetes bacterium]|nr:hypothetical protein [Bacteroidota bacterium]
MKTILLILLLCPFVCFAQDVKPAESNDYLMLLKKDSAYPRYLDTTNNINRATLRYGRPFDFTTNTVKKINISRQGVLSLEPVHQKKITVGIIVESKTALQRSNAMPALQQQFVQGRSNNGALQWQGPHTNELFSFGPSINTLEYDGTHYPYDANGKLVAAGNGNGVVAKPYSSNLFRTAALFSNSGTLYFNLYKDEKQKLRTTLRGGETHINSIIASNRNQTGYINAQNELTLNRFTINGGFNYQSQHFSNSNRNGFLNRVYAASLLTPISFDNSQGNWLNNAQRSYSADADNPYFLLQNNNHNYLQQQYNSNFSIEKTMHPGSLKITQGYEIVRQHSREDEQPGTAFFNAGIAVIRNANDRNYFANLNRTYKISFDNYDLRGLATINYSFYNDQTDIVYPVQELAYHYKRTAHDAILSYRQTYNKNYTEAGLLLSNKISASNTSAKNHFFAPGLSAYYSRNELFDNYNWRTKLSVNYTQFYSELPINQSFSGISSVGIDAAGYQHWLPVTEVSSFNNLLPAAHRELSAGFQLAYNYKYSFGVNWFTQHIADEVFPVLNGNQIQLINLADFKKHGIELECNQYIRTSYYSDAVAISNSLSFTAYRTTVTGIKDGFDYTPIAGFSNVNKALVNGASTGAIVGSRYARDAQHNIIIDNNGWPVVDAGTGVIGDAAPDFILRLSHSLQWRLWTFTADAEWKKGGDIWNGTQAMLDYYGRSAASGALRNTTGYIFPGVDGNGKPNSIPVNFYDASLPVQQNRWVRYGVTGVAESYIQKGDYIRLHTIGISYTHQIKKVYNRTVRFTLYGSNFMIWSACKHGDASTVLFDQPNGTGLDFFNIPSVHAIGCAVSLKL